jgi:hypothetical protein
LQLRVLGFGLPPEAVEGLRVVGKIVGEELQRDMATELQVFRFIDQTIPAPPIVRRMR